jgi:hypothetical protein
VAREDPERLTRAGSRCERLGVRVLGRRALVLTCCCCWQTASPADAPTQARRQASHGYVRRHDAYGVRAGACVRVPVKPIHWMWLLWLVHRRDTVTYETLYLCCLHPVQERREGSEGGMAGSDKLILDSSRRKMPLGCTSGRVRRCLRATIRTLTEAAQGGLPRGRESPLSLGTWGWMVVVDALGAPLLERLPAGSAA